MHGSSSRICFPDSEGSTARGHCQSDARTHERGPSGQDSCGCTTRSRWSVVTRHRRELGRAQAPRPLPHSRLRPIEAGGKLPERRGQGPRGPGWPGRRPPRRRLGRPPTTAAVDCRDGPRLRTAQSIRVTGRPGGTVPDGTPAAVVGHGIAPPAAAHGSLSRTRHTKRSFRTRSKHRTSGAVDARCVSPALIVHAKVPSGGPTEILASTRPLRPSCRPHPPCRPLPSITSRQPCRTTRTLLHDSL